MTTPAFSAPSLVPEGVYPIAFDHHRVTSRFGRGSLELWFRIMEFGPYFEVPVCRYYKVKRQGKRSFRAGAHSAFAREFIAVFVQRPPVGLQAVRYFGPDLLLQGKIATVKSGHDQRKIPDPARYSVVRELIGEFQP